MDVQGLCGHHPATHPLELMMPSLECLEGVGGHGRLASLGEGRLIDPARVERLTSPTWFLTDGEGTA
jgi:hypothetical protein